MSDAAPRHFIAGADVREVSYQELTEHMGVPGDVVAGLDLLTDDGMNVDKAASLLMAAHRDGRDAEAFARHLLTLRKAVSDHDRFGPRFCRARHIADGAAARQ